MHYFSVHSLLILCHPLALDTACCNMIIETSYFMQETTKIHGGRGGARIIC
jgi:hypothetical protein